jgi:preprotein translocase subunit YajC
MEVTMLISKAHANSLHDLPSIATSGSPATSQAFMMNMLLIGVLIGLFYFMMIVPQQKRFRKHREMLEALKKGDEIVTSGGLVGKIDKIKDGDDEVVIDLGNNVKVTALRSTIQARHEKTPAKDTK